MATASRCWSRCRWRREGLNLAQKIASSHMMFLLGAEGGDWAGMLVGLVVNLRVLTP